MDMAWAALPVLFPEVAGPGRWLPLLQRHAALIEAAAGRVRVTSVPAREAIQRQYAESLELLRIVRRSTLAIPILADVGSGGGFPGLVAAIACPETAVHLVEPLQKRAALLRELSEALALENVTVHPVRAEEAGRGPLRDGASVVTARAVAGLRELLEYTAPLAAPGGLIALPKGSAFGEELADAANAAKVLACGFLAFEAMRPAVSATLGVALFRKLGPTPAAYPRRPGVPGKRPL